MSGYIGPQPVPQAIQFRQTVTLSTAGQTSVPTKGYFPGYTDVYLNGIHLVSGDDYTATNGTDIVLATGAVVGDILEYVTTAPYQLVDQIFKGLTSTEKLSISGQLNMPTWNTAGRPASPQIGTIGYNTETKSLENYTDQGWLKVSVPVPVINSISGSIYSGLPSTLTLTGINFELAPATITFTSGSTVATATATPTNGGQTCAVTVPSQIYGLAVGSLVSVTIKNGDLATSAVYTMTTVGIPTGGTITTASGYRVHTFTSSGTFTVQSGFPVNTDCLVVAGGGGAAEGGGGAGGMYEFTSQTFVAGSYSVVVGAGGSQNGYTSQGSNGGNSSIGALASILGGGGGAGGGTGSNGASGGSGGGGRRDGGSSGGSGTTGQGNAGGTTAVGPYRGGAGGGGKGSGGSAGGGGTQPTEFGGAGGAGAQSSISGTATYYAGGGGGGTEAGARTGSASGGVGGGGRGNNGNVSGEQATAGSSNTGGGGGGCAGSGGGFTAIDTPKNGGSGIVIIRYPLPT